MRRRRALYGLLGLAGAGAALRRLGWPAADGPLFVERRGEGETALLCLHGLFGSSAFWTPLAEQMGPGFRVVMPDLVGFGRSPQPEADYTAAFHLDRLAPILEEAQHFTVLGHSMGCALALAAAARWPERVERVVLFNAPVYSSEANRRAIFSRQNVLTRLSFRSPMLAHLVCELTVCIPRPLLTRIAPYLARDVPAEAASNYFRHTHTSYASSLSHLVLERDLLADMAATAQPVTVIQGKEDDIVEAPGHLHWPARVRLVVEPGNHTSLLLVHPGRASALLRQILRPR